MSGAAPDDGPRAWPLTPPGPGGVALVRVAGPGATAALQTVFRPARGRWPAVDRLALGRFHEPGRPEAGVDEVLAARAGPEDYELGCHGGPAVVRRVLTALAAAGAPAGEGPPPVPGDVLAAEALAALPRATTELGCRVLLAQAAGALGRAVRAAAELAGSDPAAARERVAALRGTARLGRALLEPPAVVLVGRPNAGKSSLLNALVGRERVLVAAAAGTTRDAVAEPVELEGVPAVLVDTAGRRDAADALEAAGVARGRDRAGRGAARLVVVDGADLDPAALDLAAEAPAPRLAALNKADRLGTSAREAAAARVAEAVGEAPVVVSARTGEGVDALATALRALLVGPPAADAGGPVVFTTRQDAGLAAAAAGLAAGDGPGARAALADLLGSRPQPRHDPEM